MENAAEEISIIYTLHRFLCVDKITEEKKAGRICERKQTCKLSCCSMHKTGPFGSLFQHTVENNGGKKKQQVLSTIVLILAVITSFNFLFFPNDGLKK
jgi:hypothetical protein